MANFRVLVVDDEPLARQVAVALLRGDGEIDQIEECADGIAAQQAIARFEPDIVFLDIEMPGLNGVDVVAGGGEASAPAIVFTTAFSQYALDAFAVAATDHVLKPYSDERFREALARAKRRVRESRLAAAARELVADDELSRGKSSAPDADGYLRRMALRDGDRSIVLKVEDIVWFEAEDYYVRVHSTQGRHLVRASLTSLESRLDPRMFVRVHRTAIVNVEHVRESRVRDGLYLVLSDAAQVGVSRGRKSYVESLLSPRLR